MTGSKAEFRNGSPVFEKDVEIVYTPVSASI